MEKWSRPDPRIGSLGVKLLHSGIACLPGAGVQTGAERVEHSQRLVGEEGWAQEAAKFPTRALG